MLVTVIVPVYNVEKYIDRCLTSLVSQSYSKLEIILINDGSTDKSGNICDAYAASDDRIKVIHQVNKGISEARNTGILKASGEYLFFIDSDDELLPDGIYTLVQLAKKYKNVDIVQGRFLSKPDNWFDMWPMEKLEYPEFINDKNISSNILRSGKIFPIMVWGKLIRTALFKEQKLFFKVGIMHEDDHINLLLAKHIHSIAYTYAYCYVYHRNNQGISLHKDSHKRHLRSLKIIYNDWIENLSTEYRDEEKSFILEHSYQTFESENFNDFDFIKLLYPLFNLKLSSITIETCHKMYKKRFITQKFFSVVIKTIFKLEKIL